MITKIKCHKKVGANLKLFTDYLGIRSMWNNINPDLDELTLFHGKDTSRLIRKTKEEVEKTGYIPYHYTLSITEKGKKIKPEEEGVTRIAFKGSVSNKQTIPSINGGFTLIHYTCEEGNNYLWKCYNLDKDILEGDIRVTARLKATLKDISGKKTVNLINYVRMKDASSDTDE